MKRTTDWRRLREIAQDRCDRAAQRLAQTIAQAAATRQKLTMLLEYRRDYDARLARMAGDGIDAAKLRSYRGFLANLAQAIEQQADLVSAAELAVAKADDEWRVAQRHADSFRVLDERRMAAFMKEEARREQKLCDEIATTRAPALRGGDD